MRKIATLLLAAGSLASIWATDARVLTMGRTDNFFMDDISIYKNPANINVYPNMLLGSMGVYRNIDTTGMTNKNNAWTLYNRDPQKPFFGGTLAYSLGQGDSAARYPMISVGAVVNRYDHYLGYITPGSGTFLGPKKDADSVAFLKPLGKIDFMVGATLANGAKIGIGAYGAFNKEQTQAGAAHLKDAATTRTSLFKGTAGVNLPVTKDMNLEVSGAVGLSSAIGSKLDTPSVTVKLADNDVFFNADVRLFSALSNINGDFVPHIGFEHFTYLSGQQFLTDFNAGVAINLNIDRGFFWGGVEGFYNERSAVDTLEPLDSVYQTVDRTRVGGRVHFGIERNVIWDWLVWRVGGTKSIYLENDGSGEKAHVRWGETTESDGSDNDMVSFGMGLNIENRLKVDAVVAEDIFYTFTNLFSGNADHISTRITATYSF